VSLVEYVRNRGAYQGHAVQEPVLGGGTNYGRAALESETRQLRQSAEGTRNNALNKAAFAVGQLIATGQIVETEARVAIADAARATGLRDSEIGATLQSGIAAGKAQPRSALPRPAGNLLRGVHAPVLTGGEQADCSPAETPDAPKEPRPAAQPDRVAVSIGDVLTEWERSGPLIHEPTGMSQLDALTGGGPVYGTRWYLSGAPDAGKTALLVQLAHVYAVRGVTVGLLAVDEDADDLVTRFAQRIGYSRASCEIRDRTMIEAMQAGLGTLPIRLYDARWTIEAAADDLGALAMARAQADPASHPHGPRAMLGVDSIQTVSCSADAIAAESGRELSEVSAVSARVRALRSVATRRRLIAVATSEMGRGAYRSGDPGQQTSTLASGKWSGAIEYSARVLLGIRSVAREQDLLEIEIAKNKHGPRDEKLYLRIDRRSQTLVPVAYDAQPKPGRADRDEVARNRVTLDAAIVARVMIAKPGLCVREFRDAARAASGFGVERVNAAVARLGSAVVRDGGPRHALLVSLDQSQLDADVRRALEASK